MPQAIILRRRKLGKGSTNGIVAKSTKDIKVVRNWRANDWPEEGVPIVFRWGCTNNLRHGMVASADEYGTVVNTAAAIHWCSNKRNSRLAMQEAGVPVPKTWGSLTEDWHNEGREFPIIIRPATHSQGRELYTCYNQEQLSALVDWEHPWVGTQIHYVSKIIPKVAEYRVAVIQNRVAWAAQKTPADPSAIAWNVAQGGRFDNVRWNDWPMKVIKASLQASKLSGTDFCGVDVMVDAEGKPYVLEVNSAPSQTSPYRQSCFAKCFDWIIDHGKEHFEDVARPRRWKDVIHPALVQE